MANRENLASMFETLHAEAHALAAHVFFMARTEFREHPCAYLVEDCYCDPKGEVPIPPGWPTSWLEYWHLPEPFIGDPLAMPAVAFVGLNPSIDCHERCPRCGTGLMEWLQFWRDGFDEDGTLRAASSPIQLYGHYQRVLSRAVGAHAILGRDALVTDVIRYKAACPTGNHRGRRALSAALRHTTSLPLTLRLLELARVSVVVTVGRESTRSVGGHFVPDLRYANITEVHGRSFQVRANLCVVPALHTNHFGSPRAEDLARGIREALAA